VPFFEAGRNLCLCLTHGMAYMQVLTEPPSAGLPWPGGAQQRLAGPRAVRPQEDAALASATMRILHGECRQGIVKAAYSLQTAMRHTVMQSLSCELASIRGAAGQNHSCLPGCRSSALLEGLGWSQPLAGSIVAAQLLALGRMHAAGGGASVTAATAEPASCKGADIGPDAANGAAHGPPAASTAVSQMLAQLIPQLYRALDALPVDEFKAAAAVVSGAAVVWVGNGFTETDRVALRCRMKLMPCNSAEARGGCAFYRRA